MADSRGTSATGGLVTGTAIYAVGGGLGGLASTATFFVVARTLTTAELGYVDLLFSLFPLFMGLADTGMLSSLSYHYFAEADPTRRGRYLTSTFWYIAIVTSVLCTALYLGRAPIGRFLELPDHAQLYLLLAIALVGLEPLVTFARNTYRLRMHAGRAMFLDGSRRLAVAVPLVVLYLLHLPFDTSLYLQVNLLAAALPLVTVALFRWRDVTAPGALEVFPRMFRFGYPLVLANLSVYFSRYVDRVIVQKVLSAEQLGFYAVSLRVALVPGLIVQGFQTAWAPSMLKSALENKDTRFIARAFMFYALLNLVLLFAVGCFAQELVSLLAGSKYAHTSGVIVFLTAGTAAFGSYDILHSGIVLSRRLVFHSAITVACAVANVAISVLFVREWGIEGAALALVVSSVLAAVLAYGVAQRLFPVAYERLRVLGVLAFLFVSVAVIYLVSAAALGLRAAVFAAGMASVFFLFRPEVATLLDKARKIREGFGSRGA